MREQQFAPIIKALQQSPKGVVLGDPGGESYPFMVTIYTDDDAYWMPGATTSIFPMSHYKKVLFTYLYLNKDSRRDPMSYLTRALASSTPIVYTNMYEEIEGYGNGLSLFEYIRLARNIRPLRNPPRRYANSLCATGFDMYSGTRGSIPSGTSRCSRHSHLLQRVPILSSILFPPGNSLIEALFQGVLRLPANFVFEAADIRNDSRWFIRRRRTCAEADKVGSSDVFGNR